MAKRNLVASAKSVLRKNYRDGFTIPTAKLYPFQWNWDSGFTALGQSHFSPAMAIQEMRSLFSGQWANGMLPHIIFHSENEKTYFPNYDFWQAEINAGASRKPKTSGITQPPVHGFVLEELWRRNPDNPEVKDFVSYLFPRVQALHRFFYTYRDPEREGLVFIFHPWESGRDNSPLWDSAMDRMEIRPEELPTYERQDLKHGEAAERPTNAQYDRYVYLLELGKKHAYDGPGIFAESPFLIQDTLINAVLIQSNTSLIRLGDELGFDTAEIKEWQQQSSRRYREKLWNEELKTFVGYDLRIGKQMAHKEIGGLTALGAEVASNEQAAELNAYLMRLHDNDYYICPSFDVDSPLFDSKRYWRGPIWPQMNWLIARGLRQYGYDKTAKIVADDLLYLVGQQGFYEYFESQKELAATLDQGYGGNEFSWTAACILDFLATDNVKTT